jgi:hypothetical protein
VATPPRDKMGFDRLARFFWPNSWPAWHLARPTSRSNAKNLTACSNGDFARDSESWWPKSWPCRDLASQKETPRAKYGIVPATVPRRAPT